MMDLPAAAKPFKKPIDLPASDALSIQKNWHATLQGRQVAVLFDEGSDEAEIEALCKALTAEGDTVFTIAPRLAALP